MPEFRRNFAGCGRNRRNSARIPAEFYRKGRIPAEKKTEFRRNSSGKIPEFFNLNYPGQLLNWEAHEISWGLRISSILIFFSLNLFYFFLRYINKWWDISCLLWTSKTIFINIFLIFFWWDLMRYYEIRFLS